MSESQLAVDKSSSGEHDLLVSGIKRGDPKACEALFEGFAQRLHKYISHRLSGDELLAEEVTLKSLSDAVLSIRRFNPHQATFSAWLYGVARRNIRHELKLRTRQKSIPKFAQVSLESLGEQASIEDVSVGVTARLHAQQILAELKSCLSDEEMEVLLLHCLHQLTAKEVGEVMGRSERAVDSLLRRARQKARERMADYE
jgi:RNA polymerase sigma-70 factor, ECF subfamily